MDLWNPIHRLGVINGSSRSAGNLLNGWTDPRQLRESGLYSHHFLRPIRRDLQEGLHDGRVEKPQPTSAWSVDFGENPVFGTKTINTEFKSH